MHTLWYGRTLYSAVYHRITFIKICCVPRAPSRRDRGPVINIVGSEPGWEAREATLCHKRSSPAASSQLGRFRYSGVARIFSVGGALGGPWVFVGGHQHFELISPPPPPPPVKKKKSSHKKGPHFLAEQADKQATTTTTTTTKGNHFCRDGQ